MVCRDSSLKYIQEADFLEISRYEAVLNILHIKMLIALLVRIFFCRYYEAMGKFDHNPKQICAAK